MEDIVQIPLPLPHIRSVNTWLLRGDPLTLVDTGPYEEHALAALEAGLKRARARLEDLELVLITHHHLDHTGLAATIAARSGAAIAALEGAAAYGERYGARVEADRRFSNALMRHHGVPAAAIEPNEDFWNFIRANSDVWRTQRRLADGDHIRAGERELRVVSRPGHSTTDTLFVDDRDGLAFVGDHLLASVSSNTEVYPVVEPDGTRPRARMEYLESLRRTAAMPLKRLLSGHGRQITDHERLVRRRLDEHQDRCRRILEVLRAGPATAYQITSHLWSERTVAEQPLLVVWEVLGHLDLLLDAGTISEHVADDGSEHGTAIFTAVQSPGDKALSGAARGRAR